MKPNEPAKRLREGEMNEAASQDKEADNEEEEEAAKIMTSPKPEGYAAFVLNLIK